MSSGTNRVLRNEIYTAARRDRRSRDCFDARVIAPSFVDPAMDLSAIGARRHPHHPPKGCRKMRWILISTSGGNRRNRFVPALQESLCLFHAKEDQTLQGSLPIQLLVQSQQVEPTDACLARQILQTHCGREILAHEVFDLAQPAVARTAVVWLPVAAVPDQEMGGQHLSRSLSIKIWREFLKCCAQTQHQLAHQGIAASEAARQDRGRGTFTPEFSCDAFDGRGRKMELQGAVCRVPPPSQCSGLSRSRHTNVTRLGMRVLPTVAIAGLHVAGATGNENDQMIASSGSYEFLGLCRILVGPDQQRAPTGSPAAGRHCGAQVLVRIEARNYRLQVGSPHKSSAISTGSRSSIRSLVMDIALNMDSSLVSLDLATCTTAQFRSRSSTASTLITLPSFYGGERDPHCCQWAGPRRIFVRAGPAAGMTRRGHWASAGRRGRPDEASPRAGGRAR